MLLRRIIIMVVTGLLMILIIGCSSGGSPTVPSQAYGGSETMPFYSLTNIEGVIDAVSIMGAYDFTFDPETLSAELVTNRHAAIGEGFVVSGLGYWTVAPCGNCLELDAIMPVGDLFKVTFNIDHPFDPGDPGQPSSAKNRLDLDVFDVALVVKPRDLTSQLYQLTDGGTRTYPTVCAMADGYTNELANLTGDPAVLPYFLVVDDSESGTSTFNEFPMGSENELFDVYFMDGGKFTLYLTMGYGASATYLTRFEPKYYNPEFNRNAAWKVSVIPPNGDDVPTMMNTWNSLNDTDDFDVTVHVYDWQMGATVYGTPGDFANAPTNNVYAASEVESVSLEIPGMYNTLKTMNAADSGNGTPTNPLSYTFSVANENLLEPGTYYGLVMVLDERAPLTEADLRDFLVHSPLGTDRFNYLIPKFATYQVFEAVVVQGCGPISGQIDSPACPVTGVNDGAYIAFSASASSANGGDPIVEYAWDMDYDGVTFDVNFTGATAYLGPFDNPTCGTPEEEPVDYVVALRVTDSCDPPNVQIIDECLVTVDNCSGRLIYSVAFIEKPAADEWFDISVQPDSYVYVVADHDATGNISGDCETGLRTALRFDNDLSNMTVMNDGTGMAAPSPGARTWINEWVRMDVSAGGGITSQCQAGIGTWSFSLQGATATSEACCWAFACAAGSSEITDVTDHTSASYGSGLLGFGKTHAGCSPEDHWALGFSDTDLTTYNSYNFASGLTYPSAGWLDYCVGIDGIDGTDNVLIFYSSDTEGKISVWGDCYSQNEAATEIDFVGDYGTGPGQFQGGLDVAIDSAGNIVTLEDHSNSGIYRFQKFDSDLNFVYQSIWDDDGNPMRIDFDKADNFLYLLSTTGAHIMYVD